MLNLVDKAFLSSEHRIVIPQHALTLDSTLLCVFLYGAFGPEAEDHLSAKLSERHLNKRVLEILTWLGSPKSLPAAKQLLAAPVDHETLLRLTRYMMEAGGPQGRNTMLAMPTDGLAAASQQYLNQIRPAIQGVNYDALRALFAKYPGDKKLADAVVKVRLAAMIKNLGKDDQTNPLAILDSHLDSGFLIEQLREVRRRTLHRVSDEALGDVEVTNALINTLRYRPQ